LGIRPIKKAVKQSYDDLKKLMAEQDKKDSSVYKNIFREENGKKKEKFYSDLYQRIVGLLDKETDLFANIANVSSIIHQKLNELKENKVNWTGFYWLYDNGQLVLGSFQGNVACVRIERGKGVCGTAAMQKKPQLVPDVREFEGHISCSPDSKSEIVIPIIVKDTVVGVLDLDSTVLNGFDENDQKGLQKIVHYLEKSIRWDQLKLITHTHKTRKQPKNNILTFAVFGIAIVLFAGGAYYINGNLNSPKVSSTSIVKSINTL